MLKEGKKIIKTKSLLKEAFFMLRRNSPRETGCLASNETPDNFVSRYRWR